MWFKKHEDKKFQSVGIAFILIGATIFAIGFGSWLVNISMGENAIEITYPFVKAMGALQIIALGYIIMELDLIRHK